MIIAITAGEALDKGFWDRICDIKGINVWAIHEGLMDRTELLSLSEKEARTIGLIPSNDD